MTDQLLAVTAAHGRAGGRRLPVLSPGVGLPCDTCDESCCRSYIVTVTGLDVFRISRGLRLAPERFVVAVELQPSDHGFRIDTGSNLHRLALDKRADPGREGWCVFWEPADSGAGRCGIYRHRPGVCRTYPATLVDGEVALRDDVLCPAGSWGPASGLLSDIWRRRAEQQYAELEIDAMVNTWWNDHFRPAETAGVPAAGAKGDAYRRYLNFLSTLYGRMDERITTVTPWARPQRWMAAEVRRALGEAEIGGPASL
jgi:Fe-S-cluster containining protein